MKDNFFATGTARENRLAGNILIDSGVLKKKKGGSYNYKNISNQNIIAVKWNDNNIVTLFSNFSGVQPLHVVKRHSQKEKKWRSHMYNSNMGGVDPVRGKMVFTHSIDMCIQNAWQFHKSNGGFPDHLSFRRLITTNRKQATFQKGHLVRIQGIDSRDDRLDNLVVVQAMDTIMRNTQGAFNVVLEYT
ncbi:hypothetical protein JTB14_000234 [Gonioctena quinquepunctata]|nr:hypothetical protein JTB14_000234 [Gonioctena quinquepunctata]